MTTVVDALGGGPARQLFQEVLGQRDPRLLAALQAAESPTYEQRVAVEQALSDAFVAELDAEFEPTDRGRQLDDLLGQFLLRWPIVPR